MNKSLLLLISLSNEVNRILTHNNTVLKVIDGIHLTTNPTTPPSYYYKLQINISIIISRVREYIMRRLCCKRYITPNSNIYTIFFFCLECSELKTNTYVETV